MVNTNPSFFLLRIALISYLGKEQSLKIVESAQKRSATETLYPLN